MVIGRLGYASEMTSKTPCMGEGESRRGGGGVEKWEEGGRDGSI